ncbi:MAG: energy transducer TonB [Blastocatellia bacterium]
MFDKLVESTKEKQGPQTSRFLLATGLAYAGALLVAGVVTVFWFNPALAETASLQMLLAPPPIPQAPPPRKMEVQVSQARSVQFVLPAQPVAMRDMPPVLPEASQPRGPVVDGATRNGPVGPIYAPVSYKDDEGGAPPPAPTPKPTPQPTPEPKPEMKKVSEGVIRGLAVKKITPVYPVIAKTGRIQGPVTVMVTISEEGQVIGCSVLSGHPLLREASVVAARGWVFSPTKLSGQAVRVQGMLTFNYQLQ